VKIPKNNKNTFKISTNSGLLQVTKGFRIEIDEIVTNFDQN